MICKKMKFQKQRRKDNRYGLQMPALTEMWRDGVAILSMIISAIHIRKQGGSMTEGTALFLTVEVLQYHRKLTKERPFYGHFML